MDISWIDEGALKATDGDENMLGFPTGIPPRRFASADTVAIKRSAGILIDTSGKVDSWPIIRFVEHEGSIIALGPRLEGTKPFDAIEADVVDLVGILSAARALKTKDFPLNGLYLPAIRRLPDGGWLVFPPLLASFAREIHPEDKIHSDWDLWTHPDLTGEEGWSFSLGVLAWRILTKKDPFAEETGEARRERIRKGYVPPLEAEIPAIEPEASALIRSALTGGENNRPSLEDWNLLMSRWSKKDLFLELSAAEKEQRRSQAVRKAEKLNQRLKLRRWFRKSGWKLMASAAAAAAVISIAAAPIRHALEEPVTAGMMPLEVARTYYEAIDTLDSEAMDDCLARKVGKDDTRLVEMVFVTHKVRQGYEHIEALPNAAEWLAAGKPELQEGILPWGITELELTEQGDGKIKACYSLWLPQAEEGEEQAPAGNPRIDILSFTKARRSWEISGIERVSPK